MSAIPEDAMTTPTGDVSDADVAGDPLPPAPDPANRFTVKTDAAGAADAASATSARRRRQLGAAGAEAHADGGSPVAMICRAPRTDTAGARPQAARVVQLSA